MFYTLNVLTSNQNFKRNTKGHIVWAFYWVSQIYNWSSFLSIGIWQELCAWAVWIFQGTSLFYHRSQYPITSVVKYRERKFFYPFVVCAVCSDPSPLPLELITESLVLLVHMAEGLAILLDFWKNQVLLSLAFLSWFFFCFQCYWFLFSFYYFLCIEFNLAFLLVFFLWK